MSPVASHIGSEREPPPVKRRPWLLVFLFKYNTSVSTPPLPVKVREFFIYLRRIVSDETGETIGGTIDFIVEEYFKDQEGPGFL